MADLVGKTLRNPTDREHKKQYYLSRLVGSGGMADVYQAFDKLRATNMAVKVLRRDVASDPRFFQAFKKEAKILSQLQHPNIVRLYEFGRDGDLVFIVMAWVDGSDLKQKLMQHSDVFSLDEVSAILTPVASALNFAHQMDVYHCDIKPANILLQNRGKEVLLTDFGVARWASERTGGGTVPYMAPEQFTSATVSPRTDIYALGVTVYEMLSGGQVPFQGSPTSPGNTTRDKIAWEHVNLPLPNVRQYNPGLPERVVAVVDKALKKDPNQRYSTPLEFSGAFEEARGSEGPIASVSQTILQPPPYISAPSVKQTPLPRPSTGQPRNIRPALKRFTPYLYARSGERVGQTIPIPRHGLTIGRGANSQLRLLERSVSRSHARIIWTQRRMYLQDENSALGTYVNGQRIPAGVPIPLNHGDVIQTGYYQVFEFQVK